MTASAAGALLAVNVLYLAAGWGALSAFDANRLGLGALYMSGVSATTLVVMELAIADVRPTRLVVGGSAVAVAACGLLIGWRRGATIRPARFRPPASTAAALFASATAVVLCLSLVAAWNRGVANFDGWTYWVPKALVLHYFGLDLHLFRDVIISQSQTLFVPSFQASAFAFAGGNTMVVDVQYVALLAGFVLCLASLLRTVARGWLVWVALLQLVTLPHVIRRLLAPEGDLPWEYFFVLGTVCVLLWARGRGRFLPLGALFLAAALSAKRDGLVGYVGLLAAVPFLPTVTVRQQWRSALTCAIAVAATATPWWIWTQWHLGSEGAATAASVVAATAAAALAWWARRYGDVFVLAAVGGVLLVVIVALPRLQAVHVGQLGRATEVAARDTFDFSLWSAAPFLCLAGFGLAALRPQTRRPVAFLLALSLLLFAGFVARLLSFPVSYYDHPSLTPTTRNVAAIVLLWLAVTPLLLEELLPPAGLGRFLSRRWTSVLLWAPAAIVLAAAAARGTFRHPHVACRVPVTDPTDAAFVFGHVQDYDDALRLRSRVEASGFKGTEIRADGCGRLRVLTPHLSTRVAREQQIEARPVGIQGTIEATSLN